MTTETQIPEIAPVIADIDAAIAAKKNEIADLEKKKADVQGLVEMGTAKSMTGAAIAAFVRKFLGQGEPVKKRAGRPKGTSASKVKRVSSKGGKKRRPRVKKTAELVALIKKMRADNKSYNEIFKETGVGVQTIPKWLAEK